MDNKYKEATLRRYNGDGEEQIAEPGSLWYSTFMFTATEMYHKGKWIPYNDDM